MNQNPRKIIFERLKQDLIGPYDEKEIILSRPSDVYLTGILWPSKSIMEGEEDDRVGLSGTDENEGDNADEGEITLAGLSRPSSAGVSFAAHSIESEFPKVDVSVRFATYEPIFSADDDLNAHTRHDKSKTIGKIKEWRRKAHDITLLGIALENEIHDLEHRCEIPGIKLHVRSMPCTGCVLATITIVNQSKLHKNDSRNELERLTLFQVCIEIRPHQGTKLVARPSHRPIVDEEDGSGMLLYRNSHEFANGHTCSVEWKTGTESGVADMVATSWIPTTTVPTMSATGHALFNSLREDSNCNPLSAHWLANAPFDDLTDALQLLPAAYNSWVDRQNDKATSLSKELQDQANINIAKCRESYKRMIDGVEQIAGDLKLLRAFQLANLAMALQHGWPESERKTSALKWRPFQLGFILLTVASVVYRQHPEREFMDLLWFPTGGGKTEAYLAIIAFLAFYRRLSAEDNPDQGDGVAAIMRYTLRLLTTQQFVRAAAVILACEGIRRGSIKQSIVSCKELGNTPFSIGLWVGRNAVPNRVKDAADALKVKSSPDHPTPKQLISCPACNKKLTWIHNEDSDAIEVFCRNEKCLLFDANAPLPVWTVDEDVYRNRPTLLIGTIDKFAQIVRKPEIGKLFGIQIKRPPDLILQDELHLISGPLGTIAGLYEVAVDIMFSAGGTSPKIIGSTATIQRASEQVKSLFNRKAKLFPPPCINSQDSGFAIVDENAPGRQYISVTTAGRSAKFTLQAVAASLLQSAFQGSKISKKELGWDHYWTLIAYFNTLRELGGALVLMQDIVSDSLYTLARKRKFNDNYEEARHPEIIEELTSRRTQKEVRNMLDRLAISSNEQSALDVVLATNMLSVGVDIPRLGLMLVNGQPKSTAEYIQATSRVGRGKVPGLIVTVLNSYNARDRSYYESFPTWHETLYRDVEPTSVTPFAPRARDRALHAVFVALVRHLASGMLEKPTFNDEALKTARNLITDIVERINEIDAEEVTVHQELEKCLESWKRRNPKSYWSVWNIQNSLLQDAEREVTRRAMGRRPGNAWPTLNNMRSVEPTTPFRLVNKLR